MAKDRTTVADLITGSLVSISSHGTAHTHNDTLYTLDDSLWLATFETTFRFMGQARTNNWQVTYSNQMRASQILAECAEVMSQMMMPTVHLMRPCLSVLTKSVREMYV